MRNFLLGIIAVAVVITAVNINDIRDEYLKDQSFGDVLVELAVDKTKGLVGK